MNAFNQLGQPSVLSHKSAQPIPNPAPATSVADTETVVEF